MNNYSENEKLAIGYIVITSTIGAIALGRKFHAISTFDEIDNVVNTVMGSVYGAVLGPILIPGAVLTHFYNYLNGK